MDLAGIIWDAATRLFSCTKAHAAYVYKLEKNVELLKEKWSTLQGMEEDVETNIQSAEITGEMQRTNVVKGWLQGIRKLEKELKDIVDSQEIHNNKCLSGYCPKNCVLSYKHGKKTVKMLNKVDDLLTEGKDFAIGIAHKLPPRPVDEMPSVETVGLDLMVNQVWNTLQDDNVGIIGLYGMGGAGKTTLMKRIHNEFGKRVHNFDLVLWVVVSRDYDPNKIMNDIHSRLGIKDDLWNQSSQDKRVALIYQLLKQKKFVLMLDDLWGKLELEMVGVPIPKETGNKSKVLFTTRSEDVCAKMQAQRKLKVECLLEQEAFDLFCKKVGDETLKCHTEIPKLAKEMAKQCGGLPLALVTVGSAMAGVRSVDAWREANNDLRSSHWTASDLEVKVFRVLKFSYDKLPNATHRSCFLNCALYPEDYVVDVNDLIDGWIGEGLLGKDKSIHVMYAQGKSIIEKLKLSCLLEGVEFLPHEWRFGIKMHDVIRDMALWLARDQDGNKCKVVVEGEALAMSEMGSERLNVVERISIISSTETNWQVPACPNVITLRVRHKNSRIITDYSNLQSMTGLKVLDLSGTTSIQQVPSEICNLINLEFLNLSRTSLSETLPIELKNLKNLRVFLMEEVGWGHEIIPFEVIESLEKLTVFRFTFSSILLIGSFQREEALLEKFEHLPKLEELHIQLTTSPGIYKLLRSTKLQSCSRYFKLHDFWDPLQMSSLLTVFPRMKHLDRISLSAVQDIREDPSIFDSCHLGKLRQVQIARCHSITHLTWLKHAPLLESLSVLDCRSIEEVVKEVEDDEDGGSNRDNANDIFPNIIHFYLYRLPRLKSIHKRALVLPSLKYIFVSSCPNLRKLPLDSSSAAKDSLISIEGETNWWNNLEWEDTDTTIKHLLHSKFRPPIFPEEFYLYLRNLPPLPKFPPPQKVKFPL